MIRGVVQDDDGWSPQIWEQLLREPFLKYLPVHVAVIVIVILGFCLGAVRESCSFNQPMSRNCVNNYIPKKKVLYHNINPT